MALTLLRCDDVGPTVELTPSTLVILSLNRPLGSSPPLSWEMPRPLSPAAPAAADSNGDRGSPSPDWTLSPVPSNLPSSRSFSSRSTYLFRVEPLDWSARGVRARACGSIPLVRLLFREDPARRKARFGARSVSGICVNILPQSCTRLSPRATTKTRHPANAGPRTSVSFPLRSTSQFVFVDVFLYSYEARRIYRLGGLRKKKIGPIRFFKR